jgi:hypothetical protein
MLTQLDRLLWVGLLHVWSDWRDTLVFVQAGYGSALATRAVSQILSPALETEGPSSKKTGRCERNPQTDPADHHRQSLWRASRIRGELKMLGISISERTVPRILRTVPRPPSQT